MKDLRIYIHVPFCKQRCSYCDFVTYDDKAYLIDSYFKAAGRELDMYAPVIDHANIKSVFFGGGTPSFPEASYITELLSKCNPAPDAEISIEVNPGTVNREKLKAYFDAGINRISFGVQSFDNNELMIMGRIHDRITAIKNIKEAFDVGFTNISLDLIFGYPKQTPESFKKSLETALELGVNHLSCYSLKISEETPLHGMIKNKLLPEPEDTIDREMYKGALKILSEAGFRHYEISNFAKPGYECNHNAGYWKLDEYLGIGVGAHSYFESRRFSNTEIPGDYIRNLDQFKIPEASSEYIDESESMKEFVILGLRMVDGVNINDFRYRYNKDIFSKFKNEIKESIEEGLLQISDSNILLTRIGLDFANQVFRKFI